jgi:hypothetical protein
LDESAGTSRRLVRLQALRTFIEAGEHLVSIFQE